MNQIAEATAGGAAGAFSVAVMYPLIVVKIRLQAQRRVDGPKKYNNPVDCLIKIVKEEGIAGMFKGISSLLPKAFMNNFTFYFFYAYLKRFFRVRNFINNLLHGIAAGICVQCVMVPLEMVNVRVVACSSSKTTFWSTFIKIWNESGLAGFYKGIAPALVLTLNPGISSAVRHRLIPSGKQATHAQNFWSGAISKAIASSCTYPFVIAKVQMFTRDEEKDGEKKQDMFEIIQKILKHEGLAGLFKGLETQLGIAVLKEAILNTARHPIYAFIMSVFSVSKVKK
mmetsp:Transcript_12231/g.19879  ORF Transcript_12231/g.19879 Transcript_12231/m.19879 type:complete len:283 (+) Transcript_12231:1068-1916(+)